MVSKRKRALIIAGTASIADSIIQVLIEREYSIDATYRSKIKAISNSNINWIELDLENSDSCKLFQRYIRNRNYDLVFYCEGKTSSFIFAETKPSDINTYLQTHVVSAINIINSSFVQLIESGTFVYFSSISALNGSFDPLYACSKAALHKFIQSLKFHIQEKQNIMVVVPSLIENSTMYFEMTDENIKKHKKRRAGSLITFSDLTQAVFNALDEKSDAYSEVVEF